MAAFGDPETAAVWCARGGYGVVRILERLDFDVVRQNPKVFIGFSDISVLHTAIGQRTGLVTFHGPNLQDGFGKPEEMPAANEAALWRAVMGAENKAPSPCPLPEGEGFQSYVLPEGDGYALQTIRGGMATGQLVGGNLAVLCGLMGTPYEMETAGRILFLEDISERLYRIDRYLAQLTLGDKLAKVAGVLLGDFSYEEGEEADDQREIRALFEEYLGGLGVPVLAGFPAGHERINLTLPMGAQVALDARGGTCDGLRIADKQMN